MTDNRIVEIAALALHTCGVLPFWLHDGALTESGEGGINKAVCRLVPITDYDPLRPTVLDEQPHLLPEVLSVALVFIPRWGVEANEKDVSALESKEPARPIPAVLPVRVPGQFAKDSEAVRGKALVDAYEHPP